MKVIRQIFAATIIGLGLCGASCEKAVNKSLFKDANITGLDARGCPCCGGLMITFSGETKPYTGTFYLIDNDPAEFNIGPGATFPIAVRVQYTALDKCTGKSIHITKLERK
jgi:hypothetical protein